MAAQHKTKTGEFVAATKIALSELGYPEAWLERKIKESPSILGLGDVRVISVQRRYKKGRVDLVLSDEENGILYTVELMLGEANESHVVRCLEYWLSEDRNPSTKDLSVVAVLVAENVRESRCFPVIEFLSGKMPLTVVEVTALRVSGYTTLHFAKLFDGQDQLENTESGDEDTGRIDVDRDYWVAKLSENIVRTTESLAKILTSPDKNLRVTYLRQFLGLALGEKPANFLT